MDTPEKKLIAAALKKQFRGIAPASPSLTMTYHREGGGAIYTTRHGTIGWNDRTEYIYNALYGPQIGWYRRSFYQAIKAIDRGQFDHRLIAPDFYLTVTSFRSDEPMFAVEPPPRRSPIFRI